MSVCDFKDLEDGIYNRYLLWEEEMFDAHLGHILTCVARSYAEQAALFAQGR